MSTKKMKILNKIGKDVKIQPRKAQKFLYFTKSASLRTNTF